MTTQRETYLTAEGRTQLQEELAALTSVRRQEASARIHKASETGGTVDNAEYDEAKNEQAFIEGHIRELETILFNATVAPTRKKKTNKVPKKGQTCTFFGNLSVSVRYIRAHS